MVREALLPQQGDDRLFQLFLSEFHRSVAPFLFAHPIEPLSEAAFLLEIFCQPRHLPIEQLV